MHKSSAKGPPKPHALYLTHSHMHTHLNAHATWRNHNAPRVPSPGNQNSQNSTPGSAKPCYKILSIFLIEFPNSLKSQNCQNYQNTLFLSLNRESTNFSRLIALRHHESINKLFKHIDNHFKSYKAQPNTYIGRQWPELRKYPYKQK